MSDPSTFHVSERAKQAIRIVPNFPKPGINFRDISPLLAHPELSREVYNAMAASIDNWNFNKMVGVESRGFLFTTVSDRCEVGFVMARKPNKLPGETVSIVYEKEYGKDTIVIQKDAIASNDDVVVVDDVLATGGTALAVANLVKQMGGNVAGFVFLVEIGGLGGRAILEKTGAKVYSCVQFD